jgi:hypothetical protein
MANPFVGKDGSRHTNHDSMKRSNARFAASQPQKKMGGEQGGDGGGDDYNQGAEDEMQDGKAMAAEHGPATELTIQHDNESGRHTVHAVHPDGNEHDSEHGSAEEAHQYAADCAGVGGGADGGAGGGM